jgi:diguanylate cyclase (GGDEF)-like protein
MFLRICASLRVALEHFLAHGTEGANREDVHLVRRARAFGLVTCAFVLVVGVRGFLAAGAPGLALLSGGVLLVIPLMLCVGHRVGGRTLRVLVHATLGLLLLANTAVAAGLGQAGTISVVNPAVLILATSFLLGPRAAVGWTVVSIACLAYLVFASEIPTPADPDIHLTHMDVFVARALILALICAISAVERRFSDRTSAELEFLAKHDSVTGLLNRRALEERLAQTLARCDRYNRQFALLFIDLDDFKRVNDALGHGKGDLLLARIAARIRSMTRATDVASRVGGDEFIVLIEDFAERKNVEIYAERLLALLARPVDLGGVEVTTSASIGVASFPQDASDFEGVMRAADQAMYDAKASGGSCFRRYGELAARDPRIDHPPRRTVVRIS